MTLVRVLTKADKAALEYAIAMIQKKIDGMNCQMWVKNRQLMIGNYPGHKSEHKKLTNIVNRLRAMTSK